MADIQRLYQALDNARAAGDTDAANRLGAAIRRQLGRSPATEQGQREIDSLSIPDSEYQAMKSPAPIDQSLIGGGIREFSKQATLGYGDDISAGLAALLGYGGSGGFGDRFQTNLEYLDRAGNEFADQHPYIATGAGVAGGVAPALAGVGLAARGGSLASKALIGSGVGGAEAFVYGTGDSTGDTGERVANGVDSIPLGAGIGAAAPFVGSAARRVGAAVAAPVMSFFGRGSGPRAERYVGNTIEKSGKSLDEINREIADAITEGQPDFVLADALGRRGQRALSGVARLPGGHQNGIADFLDTRQAGQGERMAGFVRDGFGMRPGGLPDMGASGANSSLPGVNAYQQAGREGISSASQAEEVLSGYRRDISGLNYTSARNDAGPVDVRGILGLIDSRIGGMDGSNITGDGIDSVFLKFRNRLAADPPPNGEASRELSDFSRVLGVKQDISDARKVATRKGEHNKARELMALERSLDAELEASSAGYRRANDEHRNISGIIDALSEGAEMFRPGSRAADNAKRFDAMESGQQSAARIGYGDKALARIEGAAEGADKSRPFTSAKSQEDINTLATDPGLLGRRVQRERDMFETRRQALGGSMTADNLADVSDAKGGSVAGLVTDAATTGGAVTVARNIAHGIASAGKGINEETAQAIADALLSQNPNGAIQRAVERTMKDGQMADLIAAIIREQGVRAGPP